MFIKANQIWAKGYYCHGFASYSFAVIQTALKKQEKVGEVYDR